MTKPDSIPDEKWSKFVAICAAFGATPEENLAAFVDAEVSKPAPADAKHTVLFACPKADWFTVGYLQGRLERLSLPSIYSAVRALRREGMLEAAAVDGKKFEYRLSPQGLALHNYFVSEG